MKKYIAIIIASFMLLGLFTSCSETNKNTEISAMNTDAEEVQETEKKIKVLTTIFPEYDWAKTLIGDKADKYDLQMLIDGGIDLHSFQPSVEDIRNISEADLFIYVGGSSNAWVKDALKQAVNEEMITIDLMEVLKDELMPTPHIEGAEACDHCGHVHDEDEDCDHDHEECDHDHDHEDCDHDHDHEDCDHDHEDCDHEHEECDHDHEECDHDHEECDHDHEDCDHEHEDCEHDHEHEDEHDHEECDHDHEECDHDHEDCDHEHEDEHDHEHEDEDEHDHEHEDEHDHEHEDEHDHEHEDEHDHEHEDEHDHEHEDEHDHEHEHDHHHHHHHHHDFDEHVWLSLENAEKVCREISKALAQLDAENAEYYEENLNSYLKKLEELDDDFEENIENAEKDTVVFADRFPFVYLCADYDLKYYAAFSGCSAESEASFETISFLVEKVDELGIDSVFTIENSDQKIAKTIIENSKNKDIKSLQVNSMQSVSPEDIANGMTYLSIMQENLEVFKEALK